jgi:hypothetical protein
MLLELKEDAHPGQLWVRKHLLQNLDFGCMIWVYI